jgi:hypothetical protein
VVRPTFVTLGGLWCDLKEIKLQGTEKILFDGTMGLHKTHSLFWIGALWSEGCCMCLSSFMGSVIQDLYFVSVVFSLPLLVSSSRDASLLDWQRGLSCGGWA